MAVRGVGEDLGVLARVPGERTREAYKKKEMGLFRAAGNVLELFAGFGIGERPIAFVRTASVGFWSRWSCGKSCEAEEEEWRRVSESTKLVFLLATAHLGSELSNFAKAIPYTSKHVTLLANEVGLLEDLNRHHRAFANDREELTTVAYHETLLTNAFVVVSSASADPGVAGTTPIAFDKGHIDICKPFEYGGYGLYWCKVPDSETRADDGRVRLRIERFDREDPPSPDR